MTELPDLYTRDQKRQALSTIVEHAGRAAVYALALGTASIDGFAAVPKEMLPFVSTAGALGLGIITNLISDVLKGKPPAEEIIEQHFDELLTRADIAPLLTTAEFYNAMRQLVSHTEMITEQQTAILMRLIQESPPTTGATPALSVFLSYARADDGEDYDDSEKSLMRRLYNDLRAQGFAVWWDRVSMPSRGLSFSKEIEDAIRQCDRFVLVAGPGAAASDYVQAELKCARELCAPISILLRAGDHSVIPSDISDINAIDIRPPREEAKALEDLASHLRQDAPLGKVLGLKRGLPDSFIMRDAPFRQAQAALIADAIAPAVISTPTRATALYGMGGIGKSTLAIRLMQDCAVRRHFPNGVIWVEIGQTPNLQTRLADVGVDLGDVREAYVGEGVDLESASRRLGGLLQNKQALLVLDDVWDHRHVGQFPVVGTACRMLITTRSGALAGIIKGVDVRLNVLTDEEGAALIATETGAPPDDPRLMRISAALGGHTLAITLAAARLKKRGLGYTETILKGLEGAGEPFADLAVHPDDKDLNLAKSLGQSLDMLDDDLRRRFRALGIFPIESTWDGAAAAAVWGDDDPGAADRALEALLDASLLQGTDERAEAPRYGQHRLLRAYARALLEREGEAEAVFGRYADVVTRQAAAFNELPLEAWATLDPLLPHVDAVGEALVARWRGTDAPDDALTQRASDFAYAVSPYVANRRLLIDTARGRELRGLAWLEAGLEASKKGADNEREAFLATGVGTSWSAMGEQREALKHYEQALSVYRIVGDREGEAMTLNNIGAAWSALGEKRKALNFYEQALPLNRAVGDRGGEAMTLNNIGFTWGALGENRKALIFYEQALPVFRAVGYQVGEAMTLNNIGGVWSDLGETRKALEFYEQALPVFRAVGDRGREAATLNNIGLAWDALGEKRVALEFYQQALTLRCAVGDRGGEAVTCYNIGTIYESLGDLDHAVEYLERCVALDEQIEHPDLESDRRVLEWLKRKRDGEEEPQEDPQAEFMRQVMALYQQGGGEAVRAALAQAGATEEQIAAILQQLGGK